MVFAPYLLQMAETKKIVWDKVVSLGVLYHRLNFLPSIKNTLYNGHANVDRPLFKVGETGVLWATGNCESASFF